MPIAAVETLAELIAHSDSTTTTTELFTLLRTASSQLAAASFNPISLSAGTSLFVEFGCIPAAVPDAHTCFSRSFASSPFNAHRPTCLSPPSRANWCAKGGNAELGQRRY